MSNNRSNESASEQASDKQINSRLQETPIAIVGMASVFAESKNLGQFWDTIVNSVNGIQDVPEDRWAIDDYYSADKKAADKSYCKRGGFLPEIDFDPMEFGLPPNLLELTDITQLMALVVARDVLADAGISDESSFDRDKIGITLGVGGGQKQGGQLMSRLQGPVLEKVLKASGLDDNDTNVIVDKFKKAYIPWEENSFPGMLGNVIAGRIANRFNFGGTNCVVDAACAGSLAAIKMAVSDLLEHRSDMMLSGGICCDNSPFMYMSFSKTPAFTDGDCIRPFDENSNGMMIGEGVGMIALKRLEDAERDGDRIYSVIKGIGSSSDGKFKSIYAPRPEGQLKALKRAYADAGVDPKSCGLIEAHGTGTKAGDAAEFRGLDLLFSESSEEKQHVALGSVKSQIGHTKAAAGTAGLIKAALALHHKVLPATINVDKPNQNLDIENTSLYINSETRPWMQRADGNKRRAGISSFGFGGTNFHIVLEEYNAEQKGAYRLNDVPQTFLFSADNKASLVSTLQSSANALNVESELQPYAFNELVLSFPIQKINKNKVRCGFVAKDAVEAKKLIEKIIQQLSTDDSKAWSKPTGIYYREQGVVTKGKVAALFSGQGSQYLNMGRELTCYFPSMMSSQTAIDKAFHESGKASLSSVVYPIPVFEQEKRAQQELDLRLTQYAQPAIGSFSVGLFNTFKQAGFKADFAAGHSFGELTALWAAGVLSENDYMTLAMARGEAMSAPEDVSFDAGSMSAVIGDVVEIESKIKNIDGVSIANYNANNQAVIAGATDAIKVAAEQLTKDGFKVIELPVSAAFHTPLVSHAQAPFAKAIDAVTFNKPTMAVYANATGEAHSENQDDIKAALKEHILQSVQFSKEINNLYDAGARVFVEFGPKNVLTRLVDNILEGKDDVVTIATNANAKKSSDLQLRLAAIELAVLGIELENVDPYSAIQRPTVAPKKSPLAMKLSGASYVSPKTQKAFQDELTDDWKISSIAAPAKEVIKEVIVEKVVEKIVERVVEKIVYVDSAGKPIADQQAAQASNSVASNTSSISSDVASSNIGASVEQFINHQSQLLSVHQAYLEGPNQYADTFKTVSEAQAGQQTLSEGLDKALAMYHDFQTETLRVHETYLNNQTASMQQMLSGGVVAPEVTVVNSAVVDNKPAATTVAPNLQQQLQATHKVIQEHKAPIVEHARATETVQAISVDANTSVDTKAIENTMLSVVADKTGYPTEMLELSMDMEADLGIDSIKRVEILGAVQDEITDLPELDAEQLSQMRTLAEIVNYMNEVATSVTSVKPINSIVSMNTQAATVSIDAKAIENTMLLVVADKTGYPTDMLELSMDMEADLGIDSIKRVEILGAVQDEITDLPELDAEQLSQMRTLAEIVNYMNEVAASSAVTSSNVQSPVTVSNSIDTKAIENTMLSVVADKTGYPTDMLELSMDMEADLGIDSIKRVEILGAVQDEITDLPELDAEKLSQMRTLAEIVNYMNEVAASSAPVTPTAINSAVSAPSSPMDTKAIENTMLSVVADKTGYPTDMLELSMDMEADLGIDSIKRVEILGAVQDEITDLPELDAEQLSQMRTLAEIVNYMNEVACGSNTTNIVETVTTSSMPELITFENTQVDLQKIESTMLLVVADKTGYPTDMLELSMDMEADLGIDSIKRVEILGAVQDEITDLPELDAEQLSQMRTLAEIVNYMNEVAGGSNAATIAETVSTSSMPELTTFANTTVDLQKIESTMLSVVADKTGYPTDMLELSMDMEADLGIDSIKRVEILGAVQDEITDLPELDAEQLSQMRTLAEIVNYMHDVATPSESSVMKASANEDKADVEVAVLNKEVGFVPSPSSTVEVMQIPEIECIDSTVDNKNCLLVNDGLDSAVQIANHLAKLGWNVTLLTPSWIDLTASKTLDGAIANITLADATEVDIEKALGSSQWHSVIYLNPKTKVEGIRFESDHKKGLQLAFLLAKLTKLNQPALGQKSNDARSSFVVLTRQGGDFATNEIEKKVDLIQAGLAGLVKTLDHEWENVFCRILDIPSSYAANKVENIVISELNDKQKSPVEVGFNKEGRLTLVAKSTDSYALESGNSIPQDSVFLVSGGAKGVTAHCVVEIAKQHKCRFILLGRSQYQADEASWSLDHVTEDALKKAAMQHLIDSGQKPSPKLIKEMIYPVLANREITQTLANITAAGGIAEYASADVCNKQNVSDAIQPICDVWGDVTGIIHGAGVLADKYIEQKTLQEFDQVYNTKIMGLDSLLACCDINKLTHLVMFSSAAGFYGNPGQSDYAIANEILNKAAYRFKSLYPKAQVLSFNWGPWDGGMVTPELKRMFDERGVYIIPVDSGAKLLASELAANSNRCVQIVVGTDMSGDTNAKGEDTSIKKPLTGSLVKVFNTENSSLLAHHKIGENQVLPTVCAIAWMKEACEALYPDYHYQGIESFKLFKGIVFDGQEADQFLIEMKLTETKPVTDDSMLAVEVTVSSEQLSTKEKGKLQFHYRALVNLTLNSIKQMPVYGNELPLPQALTAKACESVNVLYQDGSLFHGKNFQGIKQLHYVDQSGLLMECVIGESTLAAQGEFSLANHNVLANDLVYQALLIWTNKLMGVGSLPTKTNGWQVYREVGINEVFFIKLTIIETAGQRVIGDVLLIDCDNRIISKVNGAEVTCSPTLAELFKASA